MRVALLQLNPTVGDLEGNGALVADAYDRAVSAGAELAVASELVLTGYPPEDLVLKSGFVTAVDKVLRALAARVGAVPLVVGFVEDLTGIAPGNWRPVASEAHDYPPIANAAALLRQGGVAEVYRKHRLPNYGVFDEARYFKAGTELLLCEVGGTSVGVTVCEDLWGQGGPVTDTGRAGADIVLNLNASPFRRGKRADRELWARHHVLAGGAPLVYVNQVGGQDDVVFDGDSFVMGADGTVTARAAQFAEDVVVADVPAARPSEWQPRLDSCGEVWEALVLGTRDYARKNGFESAVLGVSGGIDSALVAAVAADALGAARVTALAMPSPHSSPGSLSDAAALASNLRLEHHVIPIEPAMHAVGGLLAEAFSGTTAGSAEENIQARLRGLLLMAWSNKFGDLLLATGNKSEYAVGYATLYGDMAGGLAPLKDVPKTLVYELARWRNRDGEVIPEASITKPPSAELRPGQRDTDTLPPYEVLDPILRAYVEDLRSVDDIIAEGFDAATVERVARMVDRAEYKRRQAAPGLKITRRAFGKDRRVPITQGWEG